jgi:hypothetical protein
MNSESLRPYDIDRKFELDYEETDQAIQEARDENTYSRGEDYKVWRTKEFYFVKNSNGKTIVIESFANDYVDIHVKDSGVVKLDCSELEFATVTIYRLKDTDLEVEGIEDYEEEILDD